MRFFRNSLCANRSAIMGQVLGIVYRAIATRLARKAGFSLRGGMAAKARERAKLKPARGGAHHKKMCR